MRTPLFDDDLDVELAELQARRRRLMERYQFLGGRIRRLLDDQDLMLKRIRAILEEERRR